MWTAKHDKHGPYVQWQERLSNGRILSLAFSVTVYDDRPAEATIMPHLVVHRRFLSRLAWKRAGEPIGPGGFEVWTRVGALWDAGVEAALALTDCPRVDVEVSGETDRLFAIYRNRLEKRGYKPWGLDGDEPCVYLTLRNEGIRL